MIRETTLLSSSKHKSKEVDIIVFSPPYAEQTKASNARSFVFPKDLFRKKSLDKSGFIITGEREGAYICKHNYFLQYSKDPENIGNLPYGNIDDVV
jgi:hypothetical protein